jgi:hypothetical protein
MNRRSFQTSGFAVAAALHGPPASGAAGAQFYVAPCGRDDNPGRKEKPFATLERAREQGAHPQLGRGNRRVEEDSFVPDDPPEGADRSDRMGRLRNLYFLPGAMRNWNNLDDVESVIRYSSTVNILGLEAEASRLAAMRLILG